MRRLKAESDHDLTVDGSTLATQAIAAGLVDEYDLFITMSVVGGGTRFFPDGVRLDIELVQERPFDSGRLAEPGRRPAPPEISGPWFLWKLSIDHPVPGAGLRPGARTTGR